MTEECLENITLTTSLGEEEVNITAGEEDTKLLYSLPPDLHCRRCGSVEMTRYDEMCQVCPAVETSLSPQLQSHVGGQTVRGHQCDPHQGRHMSHFLQGMSYLMFIGTDRDHL